MKMAPALLTGNAIVIKPSPTTPLATLHLGRLCAGIIPPGLVQFLADDGPVGAMLTRHPDIRKIAFTGSTLTGKRVMQAAGGRSEEHTSELQSLMRISYAVFCLKKKTKTNKDR